VSILADISGALSEVHCLCECEWCFCQG